MAKWKVGVVGLSRGRGLANSMANHPDVEIAALCDLDREVLVEKGTEFQVEDQHLYSQFHNFVNAPVDVIVVATPIEHHAAQSIAAMEAESMFFASKLRPTPLMIARGWSIR